MGARMFMDRSFPHKILQGDHREILGEKAGDAAKRAVLLGALLN